MNPAALLAPRPAIPPCIRTEQLGVRYGNKSVLTDVTLDIPAGAITALVGPSGCGKTTFLHCLNRIIDMVPGAATTGTVWLDGVDVRARAVDVVALRRRVGLIFQRPTPFPLSIRENLEFPLREHGMRDRRERADRVEEALREVGLWDEVRDRLNGSALGLSGGQQQRLCMARALALRPEVLLMDEPCSALDPLSGSVVEELIRGLPSRYTVLVVTHNLAQARRIADYAALFWAAEGVGGLVEAGPAAEFFERPRSPTTAAYVSGARG